MSRAWNTGQVTIEEERETRVRFASTHLRSEHSAFYQLIDTLSMDYRITETFRSKFLRNVRLWIILPIAKLYIYIYIYLFVFIRFFLSKRKFYVDITRLVIILVIIAKWTSKDGEKRKKFELLPFAVSLDNGDFSHETRIPRHLTVTCRVLTASTRQRSRVGAQRLDTSRRELRRILAIFSRRFLSPRELNNNKRRDANRISVSFLRFWG